MTTDLDARLHAVRPDPHWTQHERDAVLDRVLAEDRTPHRTELHAVRPRRRRAGVVAALAGLAAAAAVAVPIVLPDGSPGSAGPAAAVAQLRHLARIAANSPADRLRPDQYWHFVTIEEQAATPGQPAGRSRFEFWTSAADGRTWQLRHTRFGNAPARDETAVFGPTADNPTYPSPQYLRTLPTSPGALEAYLRAHTTGSSSKDEAVFSAVSDLLRGGIAPPELRTAAIQLLADLSHVELGAVTRDATGTAVQEFVFRDERTRPGDEQSMMFDTGTAQLTEERQYVEGDVHYQGWVATSDVSDQVPAEVLAQAVPVD